MHDLVPTLVVAAGDGARLEAAYAGQLAAYLARWTP
jgi:hypothetical protein